MPTLTTPPLPTLRLAGFLAFFILSCISAQAQWVVAKNPWPESFGSQRAVLNIPQAADAAEIQLVWRRHDRDVDQKRFLIVHGATGDTVQNVRRIRVDSEGCALQFGPVSQSGLYYFYYLPFEVQEGWGFYGRRYLKPEPNPDPAWLNRRMASGASAAKARLVQFESRTSFDNFAPMELVPNGAEMKKHLTTYTDPVLIYTESRENPIRMKDRIPWKWTSVKPGSPLEVTACRNEYFTFQVGVFAARTPVKGLEVSFPDPPFPMTCFNTEGVDPHGKSFKQTLDIDLEKVQALWIGADIPETVKPGIYTATVAIRASNLPEKRVTVRITVTETMLADRGDSEPWRHSRLRWLNSTAGSEGEPIPPYKAIKPFKINAFDVAGHQITLDPSGLPAEIQHKGSPVLGAPASLRLFIRNQPVDLAYRVTDRELRDGYYRQTARGENGNIRLTVETRLEYDGYLRYTATLDCLNSPDAPTWVTFDDIRLDFPLAPERARYMMGMGLPGGNVPLMHTARWKGPHDSYWIGDTYGGIWCELRGSTYHGPLLNLYKPAPPPAWDNEGNGGFSILPENGNTVARTFTGPKTLRSGERIRFEWALLVTPVKTLDPAGQFQNRYYHSGAQPTPSAADFAAGVRIVNVHHANKFNPFINWPFIAVDEMKGFTDSIHSLGKKVKIYYTVRELTNHVTEIWALRSLGSEILADGAGGGYPWLREHFVDGYTPQWYQHFPDGQVDASVLSAPGDGRWLNYYIEGLAWLVKNVGIDGLYLDDVSFDRTILKRMRTVMSRINPGCVIDLHSNTGFSIGPATQYTEFFPFVDKLWFGESFQYDRMSPENWLVETSGIPFGLMGDMLQGGGNRWLGMVFGMTTRLPWSTEGVLCDPKPVWKLWDDFRIHEAQMIGFWDAGCPVTTSDPQVKATVYHREGATLIALGNFSDENRNIVLNINREALNLPSGELILRAPEIENFQPAREYKSGEKIVVEARRGTLLKIEE